MSTTTTTAQGVTTINSTTRPECHAPSGHSVKDYSGANGARARQTGMVLDYWQAMGVLRTSCPRNSSCPVFADSGACDVGGMHVRDVVNPYLAGMWFPLAGQDSTGRATRAELSHVIASANGGAYCACGLLPESGARNASRGDRDMIVESLPASALSLLNGWPAYWTANVARKASLARLKA